MLTTQDGFEYELGPSLWHNQRQQYETAATIIDGDKRLTLTVVTGGHVKANAVTECVHKSMQQWSYRGEGKPAKGTPVLKGGT